MNHKGWTPKEYALSLALGEMIGLVRLYEKGGHISGPPSFQRETIRQLAKLHNSMLEKSKLDGLFIEPRFSGELFVEEKS